MKLLKTNNFKNKTKNILIVISPSLKWFFEFRIAYLESRATASIKEIIWAYLNGFYVHSVKLCGITKQNKNDYLKDKIYNRSHPINGSYSTIIDNKLYLPFLLKDFPGLVPKYYFFIDKGIILNLDATIKCTQNFPEFVKGKNKVVLKPCWSSYGHGFYLLESRNNAFFLNSIEIGADELVQFINSLDNYIVTEYINQEKYANAINPSSVNTVRILCMWDNRAKEFFISSSFHRFGMKGKLVDNLGSEGGGILMLIDIESGKTKQTGIIKNNNEPAAKCFDIKHPESKYLLSGLLLPHWEEITKSVLNMLNHLSFLKLAAIDIVITTTGFKILEINSLPDLFPLQLEEGLKRKQRIKEFISNYIQI